jgi:hypothetical protein
MNARMPSVLDPFRFVLIALVGWVNQRQLHMIDYLREENRVLREQLGGRRLQLHDDQRRRLAAKAKLVGRKLLAVRARVGVRVFQDPRAQVSRVGEKGSRPLLGLSRSAHEPGQKLRAAQR